MKHIFKHISILSLLTLGIVSIASCKNNGKYVNKEEKEEFETIEFGSFAQSVVTDNNIISQLDELTKDQDDIYFNTLQYIPLDGENYVKGIVDPYKNIYNKALNRPFYKFDYTEDEDGKIPVNTIYAYFKVEPIKFIKRTYNEETIYISEDVLFCKQYSEKTTGKYDTDEGKIIYPNNYIKSELREYLNNDFYNLAFSSEEKLLINDHITKNDLDSAAPSAQKNYLPMDGCIDKVFIPSYDEVDKMFKNDISRSSETSDYARSQGCVLDVTVDFYGNAYYYTRSSLKKNKDYVNFVNNSGMIIDDKYDHGKVQTTISGIRIMISLNI